MAQIRYNNWQDFRYSDVNNRKDLGTVPDGRWRGFDYDGTSAGTALILSHLVTGYSETAEDATAHSNLGMVKTKQGVLVVEDAAVHIALTDNSGGVDTRIDLVVLQHTYVATPGGVAAGYSVLLGTVGSGVPPAIPFPLTTIVLGTITWPAGGTNIAAATYVQAPAPVIGGGDIGGQDYVLKSTAQVITGSKQIYNQTGKEVTMTYGSHALVTTVDSNFYSVANIDADYHILSTITKPTSADLTHFSITTQQRFKIDSAGNIGIPNGAVAHVEAGETFELYCAGGAYILVKGDELTRSRITKLFAAIVGSKATASYAANRLTLSGLANYYELDVDLSTHPQINLITGYSALWDGTNTITKGGNFFILKVHNTGGAGYWTLVNTGVATGVYKPLTFSDNTIGTDPIQDGGYALIVENENDYCVIATFDVNTSPNALWDYINNVNSDLITLEATVTTLIADIITINSQLALGTWAAIPLTVGWTAGSPTPQYRKDGMGRVWLRGNAVYASGAGVICTLPAGSRPTIFTNVPVRALMLGTETVQVVSIDDTNGRITAVSGTLNVADVWNVDGVAFLNS